MKFATLLLIILVTSCKTSKPTSSDNEIAQPISVEVSNCPENGSCNLELIPNKSLIFKKDKFGNLYPEISEGNKTLLKFSFTKNKLPNVADSSYQEIVYAELENELTAVSIKDESLKNIKMHYGRLCYCKGESGYFPITNGVFVISKTGNNSLNIQLDFSIKRIPKLMLPLQEEINL